MKYFILCITILVVFSVDAQKRASRPKPTLRQADSLFLIRDWQAAIPIYEAVLKAEPNNSLGWNRLGFSYHNLSDYGKALANYSKSLEYKPNAGLETTVQSRMARVYAVRKEIEKAFQSLDRALQLGYANLSELETQKEFDNIRTDSDLQR